MEASSRLVGATRSTAEASLGLEGVNKGARSLEATVLMQLTCAEQALAARERWRGAIVRIGVVVVSELE